MDTNVGQAYYTVQLSAKEMIKNNRRQHYCNIIDLLASSCKASGLVGTSLSDDELIEFWLGDILPLMFDADRNIQTCAIAALAEALVALDVAIIHGSSAWPQIRGEFIDKYSGLIGEMREAKNSNWHKVWTLLVQIMDEELLRGCKYINKFLAVVELGFRNSDNGVRAEAFLCWRVLIKIFATYNELAADKRLRLLLIPLRTSQSRSSHVSGIKLRVWWYLLTCLDEDLSKILLASNSQDNAVELFLSFIFGGGARAANAGLAHSYQTVRELALPCLVALWSSEPSSEPLQRLMRELRLETLSQPSPLMRAEVLQQHWRPLLAAAMSGLALLCKGDATEADQQLLQLLSRNLTLAMFQLNVTPFIVGCCGELEKADGRVLRAIFNNCATDGLILQRTAGGDYLDVLEAWLKLCLKARVEVPAAILQRCVALIFAPEQLQSQDQNEFRLLSSFAEQLMQSSDEEDYDSFALKLNIWRQVSTALLSYLRENALEYRLLHNANLFDQWILWPLQACAGFAGRRINSAFDGGFCEQWRQLLNAGHNAPERKKFLTELQKALSELLLHSKAEPHFAELFDAYVGAVAKLGISKETPLYKDVFALLAAVFERPALPQPTLEGCLNSLRHLILELRQNELVVVFDALKPLLASALQCWTKLKCEGSFLVEWKRSIQEKFRKQPTKSMREVFKGDDLFVIIPSVWSLNPEKLTERQKERFAEKSDIPALYNDMSQSQDASIKPWTPKKVVIAKNKQAEVAIAGKEVVEVVELDSSSNEGTESAAPAPTPAPAPSTETPRKSDSFRKPKQLEEAKEDTPVRLTRQRLAQKEVTEPEITEQRQLRSPAKQQPRSPAKQQPQLPAAANKTNIRKVKVNLVATPTHTATPTATPTVTATATPTANQSEDLFPEVAEQAKKTQSIVAETQMSAAPQETISETVPNAQPAQLISSLMSDASVEPLHMQESSPRKQSARLCNLNSPPDRKQTNNSSSPTLRPKPPSAHLTGRGAQLINMIRNKKLESSASSPYGNTPSSSAAAARAQLSSSTRLPERSELVSTPTAELNELMSGEHTSTPIQAKTLLVFSKRLPSPSASPSASILKRKLRNASIDDGEFDSPALKRKRVSFHDPPVSLTKEYLRDVDESRTKPKRCLQLDKLVVPALKRRGRLDSIIEIERFAKEQTARTATVDKTLDKSTDQAEDEAFTSLKWNETHNASGLEAAPSALASRDLAIMDTDAALDLVVEQCSLENVLERYFAKPNSSSTPHKNAQLLARFLSSQMGSNDKLKTNVLETLSENHSKDFLDHAVRENLSSVVCDRLNPNSVLDYICAKAKINTSCRSNLLQQLPDILKSSRVSERLSFVQELLLQCSFNDDQMLDVIAHLMRARDGRQRSSEIIVAETLADSSSNL